MTGAERVVQRVVAIDGPAGSGKSTVARLLAKRLGWFFVDTGAMYRALTWAVLKEGGVSPEDENGVIGVLEELRITWGKSEGELHMQLDGASPPEQEIRGGSVSRSVSIVASHSRVREWMVMRQRELLSHGPLVMEGRDIGSVVFPEALLKVYLDASPRVRARRRMLQQGEDESDLETVEAEIRRRDKLDQERACAPLRISPDARVLDTTDRSLEEVLDCLESWVHERKE